MAADRAGRNGASGASPAARLTTDEMVTLRQAALAGVGIVQLPDYIVAEDVAGGNLEVLLPGWSARTASSMRFFPSRLGFLPALRYFIDFLAVEMREL